VTRPGVVMVTGAYYPELSGAGLQCRCLVRALGDRADCAILTTSTLTGPAPSEIDGVPVERVPVSIGHPASEVAAGVRLAVGLARLGRRREIVHFHGFSRKSVPLMALARLLGKRRIVKLTSVGHDDPVSIIARGGAIAAAYRQADMYIAVSPGQRDLCIEAGIARDRFRLVPNGVDLERFRPAKPGEREAVRQELGLRIEGPIVLFVGFFSREKQPDVLFEAWRQRGAASSTLVFVGATRSQYYEVDPALVERIRADAGPLRERIVFVERAEAIEKYYRAADVFALPSSREGLPNVLLEAMASGLACVASRLPGVTDDMLDGGVSGRLVPPGDVEALSAALAELLADVDLRARMGATARRTAVARYGVEACADAHLDVYGRLIRL
jgi:glycosyltransferase involved in cell wall biosynthesis